MCGTDLDQADLAAADVQLELPENVRVGGTSRTSSKAKGLSASLTYGAIAATCLGADRERHRCGEPQRPRERAEALHLRGGLLRHDGGRGVGGDDLGAGDLLVAPPVVAVGVRVDEGLDRRPRSAAPSR